MREKRPATRVKNVAHYNYRLEGRKIQTGKANENGDVEQRHYRLKKALEQALLLRDGTLTMSGNTKHSCGRCWRG